MPSVAPEAVPTTQTLRVEVIHALDTIQPRAFISEEVIAEYETLYREAEGDAPLPPLDVFQIRKQYFVSDGFHRLAAATRAERQTLACRVYQGS
jgi:uncharacterized ParB-like nuclease family protein